MQKLLFSVSVLLSSISIAANIDLKGRLISPDGCTQLQSVDGQFFVSYSNSDLKWGSRVYLVYGFKNLVTLSGWNHLEEVEMKAVSPFHWHAIVFHQVANRGAFVYGGLDFVIRVVPGSGEEFYEKGSATPMGYYHADFQKLPIGCVDEDTGFSRLSFEAISK